VEAFTITAVIMAGVVVNHLAGARHVRVVRNEVK